MRFYPHIHTDSHRRQLELRHHVRLCLLTDKQAGSLYRENTQTQKSRFGLKWADQTSAQAKSKETETRAEPNTTKTHALQQGIEQCMANVRRKFIKQSRNSYWFVPSLACSFVKSCSLFNAFVCLRDCLYVCLSLLSPLGALARVASIHHLWLHRFLNPTSVIFHTKGKERPSSYELSLRVRKDCYMGQIT